MSDPKSGGGCGVENLAAGSIVWKLSSCKELREALRWRKERSTGTVRVLTVWPGRKGQAVVQGSAGSYVSVEPLTSYCGKERACQSRRGAVQFRGVKMLT